MPEPPGLPEKEWHRVTFFAGKWTLHPKKTSSTAHVSCGAAAVVIRNADFDGGRRSLMVIPGRS
jgi:hypothetical protein